MGIHKRKTQDSEKNFACLTTPDNHLIVDRKFRILLLDLFANIVS